MFTSNLNMGGIKLGRSKMKEEVEELTLILFTYHYGWKPKPNNLHVW